MEKGGGGEDQGNTCGFSFFHFFVLLQRERIFGRTPANNVNAALEAVVEMSLSTAASEHLGLDDLLRCGWGETDEKDIRVGKKRGTKECTTGGTY
jgi:hypothetical protein